MSHVILIAADRELPLCDKQEFRENTVTVPGGRQFTIGCTRGFMIAEHNYYRNAADVLGFEMKPFQYEVTCDLCETDLNHLIVYLKENFSPGEKVELWSLWVGSGGGKQPRRYQGRLLEFDLDALGMLTEIQKEPDPTSEYPDGLFSQICLTVEI